MKKMLLAAVVILSTVNIALAQSTRFGFSGGVSLSNMLQKLPTEKSSGLYRAGVTFGILADLPMQKNGSFQAGLNFVQKGTHNKKTPGNPDQKTQLRLNYVEVPLNVMFNIPKTKLTIGGGPAFAIGIGGEGTVRTNGTPVTNEIKFGDEDDADFKGLDFGLNGQVAYTFNRGLFLAVNYTHGINSLYKDKSPDGQLYNKSFGFKVGYIMKRKTKVKKSS
jgi:hypothetical protein